MHKYIKQNKLLFILSATCYSCAGFLSVFLSFIMKTIIDSGSNRDMEMFYQGLIYVITFIILNFIITMMRSIFKAKFLRNVIVSLKKDLFKNIISSDFDTFNNSNSSINVSIFNNDIKLIETNYFDNMFNIIADSSQFILCLMAVFTLQPILAVIIVVINISAVFLPMFFSRSLAKKQSLYVKGLENFNIKIKDFFNGFELIKSFNLEKIIENKFNFTLQDSEDRLLRFRYVEGKINGVSTIFSLGISTLTSIIAVYFVINGSITLGTMMAVIQLVNNIANPLNRITKQISDLISVSSIVKNIVTLLDATKEKNQRNKKIENISEISIQNLSFRYSDQAPVLQNINYTFESGKKYAIVGSSGSGKSTLLKVIMQYYDNYSGKINYDNENAAYIDKESISKNISIIHQNVFMFNDTIKNNICLYQNYNKDKLHNALKESGLKNFVSDLPNGVETLVNENGNNFSGGEKQRISIARALIKNTSIIFVDEATASLDNAIASEIDSTILLKKDITCLVVTHRLQEEPLKKYDDIIVLSDGKIVENGKFNDLILKKSYFYQLYYSQQINNEKIANVF